MSRQVIYTDQLMRPIAHFSHASKVGHIVHVGASAGVFPDLRLAGDVPGRVDMDAQARRMFANLRNTLDLLGADEADVVRIKAYVADHRDIAKYQEIYRQEFPTGQPAHCVVGSWAFPLPQAAVEIDTTAIIGGATPGDPHYVTALPIDTRGHVTSLAIEQQAIDALNGLAAKLADDGLSPKDICNLHVTIADIRDAPVVAHIFSKFFGDTFPTWTVVGAPLDHPALRIAIESTAIKGGGRSIGTKLTPVLAGKPAPAMLAGDMLFLSGQLATDDGATEKASAGNVELQTRAAWKRLHALIDAAGFAEDSMIRTNNVLTDWRDFAGFNAGYGPNVAEPYLPRATVLGQLSNVDAKVQIEGIAHRHGADATIVQVAPLVERHP